MNRVCVDARHLAPEAINGTGVYAVELLRHLPATIETAALVSAAPQREAFERLGIRVVEDEAELARFDVCHRPSQIYERVALERFLRSPAAPVLTCLDLISFRAPALFADFRSWREYRGLLYASLEAAEAVIAISEHGRREIVDEFALSPERVHCTPLGVDLSWFGSRDPERNADVLHRHGIAGPYFLCTGTDFPHKNLPLLLRGYALLRARWRRSGPVPGVVLFGPASGAPGGLFALGPHPARGVHYLGAVDRRDVPSLYQEALAFAYPSTYEGFGLPVLEAMAAGVPVLCTRLTAIPEVAGNAALYLDELSVEEMAEKMLALTTDDALRARLVAAGHERARMFPWEATARKTAEIYARVAGRPSERAPHRHILGVLGAMRTATG